MQRQVREFDLDAKAFVAEAEGGFALPEAKSRLCYKVEMTRDQREISGRGPSLHAAML